MQSITIGILWSVNWSPILLFGLKSLNWRPGNGWTSCARGASSLCGQRTRCKERLSWESISLEVSESDVVFAKKISNNGKSNYCYKYYSTVAIMFELFKNALMHHEVLFGTLFIDSSFLEIYTSTHFFVCFRRQLLISKCCVWGHPSCNKRQFFSQETLHVQPIIFNFYTYMHTLSFFIIGSSSALAHLTQFI